MKKKFLTLSLCTLLAMGTLAGCSNGSKTEAPSSTGSAAAAKLDLKIGMVTDSGTIDDKSFNQGTWEGIKRAETELGVETNYLKPTGTTEADYLKEIGNLYDADYKFIVTPGFKFETAIFKAQDKYPDAKFVLLDGNPHNGDMKPVIKENSVAIFFAEHEAGFLAGVATALEQKQGDVGFIGGMEIPPVQRFNWGFQQGIQYANKNLGTTIGLKAENIVYQGSFDNVPAGQQIAAQMYDKGVKSIFCAAGGVGVGAINEAKERASKGEQVWFVGVDVDQYSDGLYSGDKSVVLTSAVKKIDNATLDMIKADIDGSFPGGKSLIFDAKNDGIGLPEKNPNLSADTITKVNEIFEKLKTGEITVKGEQVEGLIK
ncbi:MAG: BMP family ABC transporter substrate-binding protein [Cellulosilyticaceae bacterium]